MWLKSPPGIPAQAPHPGGRISEYATHLQIKLNIAILVLCENGRASETVGHLAVVNVSWVTSLRFNSPFCISPSVDGRISLGRISLINVCTMCITYVPTHSTVLCTRRSDPLREKLGSRRTAPGNNRSIFSVFFRILFCLSFASTLSALHCCVNSIFLFHTELLNG